MQRILLSLFGLLYSLVVQARDVTLLNVSHDATRELYQQINTAFAADYKANTGDSVTVRQSHGGSSKQARPTIARSNCVAGCASCTTKSATRRSS